MWRFVCGRGRGAASAALQLRSSAVGRGVTCLWTVLVTRHCTASDRHAALVQLVQSGRTSCRSHHLRQSHAEAISGTLSGYILHSQRPSLTHSEAAFGPRLPFKELDLIDQDAGDMARRSPELSHVTAQLGLLDFPDATQTRSWAGLENPDHLWREPSQTGRLC